MGKLTVSCKLSFDNSTFAIMIPRETIDRIFSAAHIEEVIGDFVNLKKRGVNYLGLCPFHNEKTPSFSVSVSKGIYKCFGCGRGGNVVNFVMEHEQMNYVNALRYLAKKYNIEIVEQEKTNEEKESENEREILLTVCAYAQKYFSSNLTTEIGKAIGYSYFEERGFTPQTIEKFQLGYAFDNRSDFLNAALKAGYSLNHLLKAGLVSSAKEQDTEELKLEDCYDKFAGRVLFPIHNITGRVIAFGARTLRKDKNVAKYINSPETPLYHKTNVLYGIHLARRAITSQDNCFLVEGYIDVISLVQNGIENVVASSGTSLTVEQIRLIRRYTPNLTIIYDSDAAGVKASERGIPLALKEGMNVKIVLLPPEDDPDTFARRHSSEEINKYFQSRAVDFIVFRTRELAKETVNNPVKKVEMIKEIIATISLIDDRVARTVYIKECSRLLDIDEGTLWNELRKEIRKRMDSHSQDYIVPAKVSPVMPVNIINNTIATQEMEIIRVLLKYGNDDATFYLPSANEDQAPESYIMKVADYIIESIDEDDYIFEDLLCRKMYEKCNADNKNGTGIREEYFLRNEEREVSELTMRLVSEPYFLSDWKKRNIEINSEKDHLGITVEKAIYSLKSRKVEMMIRELQELIRQPLNDEEMNYFVGRKIKLDEANKEFKKHLGRVI